MFEKFGKKKFETNISRKNGTFSMIKHQLLGDKIALVSIVFLTVLFLFLILSFFIIDADLILNARRDLTIIHRPPSRAFWLGTDERGRDGLAMLVIATRNTLMITLLATMISSVFGVMYGLFSGYVGGLVDRLMNSIIDVISSIPNLILMLLIINFIGGSFSVKGFIFTLSVFAWTNVARVVRARVIQERELEYVIASKTLGTSQLRIIFKKLIPNLSTVIIASVVLNAGNIIIIEAGLAFFNFQAGFAGGPLPNLLVQFSDQTPTLGTLLVSTGYTHILRFRWWRWVPAMVVIVLVMFSINSLGNMLNRTTDVTKR